MAHWRAGEEDWNREQLCVKERQKDQDGLSLCLGSRLEFRGSGDLQEKWRNSVDKVGLYFPCLCLYAQERLRVPLSLQCPHCSVPLPPQHLNVSPRSGAQ